MEVGSSLKQVSKADKSPLVERDVRDIHHLVEGLVPLGHHNCASHHGKVDQGQENLGQDQYLGVVVGQDTNGDPDNQVVVHPHHIENVQRKNVKTYPAEVLVVV